MIKLIARDVVDRRGSTSTDLASSSYHGRLELFLHSFVWHQSAEHQTRAVALCRLDVVQCCLAAARQTVRGTTGCRDLRASRSTPQVFGDRVTNVDDFVIKKGISENCAPPAGPRSVCHAPQSTRPTPPIVGGRNTDLDIYEHKFDTDKMMPTPEQILSSALHGDALRRVDRPEIRAIVAELAELAEGRDDVRTECAGIMAGSRFAFPSSSYAEELVAAGLLRLKGTGRWRCDHSGRQRGRRPTQANVELV